MSRFFSSLLMVGGFAILILLPFNDDIEPDHQVRILLEAAPTKSGNVTQLVGIAENDDLLELNAGKQAYIVWKD